MLARRYPEAKLVFTGGQGSLVLTELQRPGGRRSPGSSLGLGPGQRLGQREARGRGAGVDLHGVHNMLRPTGAGLSPEEDRKVRQLQWDSSPLGSIDRWRSPVV